jgi:hypothetical protein
MRHRRSSFAESKAGKTRLREESEAIACQGLSEDPRKSKPVRGWVI